MEFQRKFEFAAEFMFYFDKTFLWYFTMCSLQKDPGPKDIWFSAFPNVVDYLPAWFAAKVGVK